MLLGTLALALLWCSPAVGDESWQWRAAFGGELNSAPHAVVDLGVRKGPLSAQILTDTLDVRYEPGYETWRWWVGGRFEVGAAGPLASRWSDGAPDASSSFLASYVGVDTGVVTYLPAGFYVGGEASVRGYTFGHLDPTMIPVPDETLVVSPALLLGWWQPWARFELRGGADVQPSIVAPRLAAEAVLQPDWWLAPLWEIRAGWAKDQDLITLTRLGGLNPYVVPLAGTGWAEFYVEKYAATRVGVSLSSELGELAVFTDTATFDDHEPITGFGAMARFNQDQLFVEAIGGYAPFVERKDGTLDMSVWLLAGIDWVEW